MDSGAKAPYKIVLFGKAAVGKTSLFAWALKAPFDVNVASTISVMFTTHSFSIDGSHAIAQIWDTAGQERYASITKSYFQDASGGLGIFDLTDVSTLDSMIQRVTVFKENARPGAAIVLVGNKKDLLGEREVPYERGQEVAKELGASYIETSAKDTESVEEAFALCMRNVMKAYPSNIRALSIVLSEQPAVPAKSSKCCK